MKSKHTLRLITLILSILSIFSILSPIAFAEEIEETTVDSINQEETQETQEIPEPFTWYYNDGHYQYTDELGLFYIKTYVEVEGYKYYFDNNGYLITGVYKIDGKIYYFNDTKDTPQNGLGALKTSKGFIKSNKKIYYVKSDSTIATSFFKVSSHKYYANSKGQVKTGFQTINKKKYYFRTDGALGKIGRMFTGLHKIGKYKYYFSTKGVMYKNGVFGNKKDGYYCLNKKGQVRTKIRKAVTYKGVKYNALNGKAYKVKTEKDMVLFRTLKLVSAHTKDSMSKYEKLKTMWVYIRDAYVEKNPRIPHYHGANWELIYANDLLINGVGNCMSYGSLFGFVAKAIGYKNIYACNSGGHGWAEINGNVYDPEWCRHHGGGFRYFNLSYNTPCDQNYRGALSPGYSWMRIKI